MLQPIVENDLILLLRLHLSVVKTFSPLCCIPLLRADTRGDNILDLIFSTNNSVVSKLINTGPEFSTNNQRVVSFNINLEVYKDNVSEEFIFIYRKGNFEKLKKILADTN